MPWPAWSKLEFRLHFQNSHIEVANSSADCAGQSVKQDSKWLKKKLSDQDNDKSLPSIKPEPLQTYRSPRWTMCIMHQRMVLGWKCRIPMRGPCHAEMLGISHKMSKCWPNAQGKRRKRTTLHHLKQTSCKCHLQAPFHWKTRQLWNDCHPSCCLQRTSTSPLGH